MKLNRRLLLLQSYRHLDSSPDSKPHQPPQRKRKTQRFNRLIHQALHSITHNNWQHLLWLILQKVGPRWNLTFNHVEKLKERSFHAGVAPPHRSREVPSNHKAPLHSWDHNSQTWTKSIKHWWDNMSKLKSRQHNRSWSIIARLGLE